MGSEGSDSQHHGRAFCHEQDVLEDFSLLAHHLIWWIALTCRFCWNHSYLFFEASTYQISLSIIHKRHCNIPDSESFHPISNTWSKLLWAPCFPTPVPQSECSFLCTRFAQRDSSCTRGQSSTPVTINLSSSLPTVCFASPRDNSDQLLFSRANLSEGRDLGRRNDSENLDIQHTAPLSFLLFP